MSYSAEAILWARSFFSRIDTRGLRALARPSEGDRPNASAHLLVETASSATELIVWDSGDAELMIAAGDEMSQMHFDISNSTELRKLLAQFGHAASDITTRESESDG